jgi:hypothetical protein
LEKKDLKMDIKRSGSQPSGKGPADYFTGTVLSTGPMEKIRPGDVVWIPPLRSTGMGQRQLQQ